MSYTEEKHKVLTHEGVCALLKVNAQARVLLEKAGAFRASALFAADDWLVLNCLDFLTSEGYLKEITGTHVMGQERVYVAGEKAI